MDPVEEGQQFDLVLPSNSVALGVYDNRPQRFRVDLPAPLNLVGAGWEVGFSELLYTHTFFEPPPVTLGPLDRTVGIEPGYNGTAVQGYEASAAQRIRRCVGGRGVSV